MQWSGYFDVVYSSMVLHHILNIKEAFYQWNDWMTPNGHLILIDLNEEDGRFHSNEEGFHGHNGFNQDLLKQQLIECGYKNIQVQTIYEDTKDIDNETIPYSLFLCKAQKL